MNLRTYGYWFWLLAFALDQLTKYYIVQHVMQASLPHGHVIPVLPIFNIVLVWNKGTSFGIVNHAADVMPYLLSCLAIGVCIWLNRWLNKAEDRWHAAALGLIIGGALGNVVDRLVYGAVVDFLDFYYNAWHWPAFNVADSAVVVGVGMLLLGGNKKTA